MSFYCKRLSDPLGIHWWKTKPKTKPDKFPAPNPKTVGEKSSPNQKKTARPEIHGYQIRNRTIAILSWAKTEF